MKNKGFTLIELMVVIGVMAILLAIALPSYTSFMTQKRLSGAAMQLQSDLMGARMQAVSQNTPIIVSLINNHQYMIVRDINANNVVDNGETGPTKDIYPNYNSVSIAPATTGYNPIFYPNGTSLSGTINITSSKTSSTKTITINTSGYIKVQ